MANSVFITGANRGIGLEFAHQYAADGWQVYAACRSPERAIELTELAAKPEHNITVMPLDVSDLSQITALNSALNGATIDILINNAGVYGSDASELGKLDAGGWLETLKINTVAPLKIMETLLENVAASELKIIAMLSSQMGSIADNSSGGSYAYRSSKAGLNAALKSAALDLQTRNIIAVSLHPGWLQTDMGGPNAIHSVSGHIGKLRKVLAGLGIEHSGQFLNYDAKELPW